MPHSAALAEQIVLPPQPAARVKAVPSAFPLAAGLGTAILGKPRRVTELFGRQIADSDRLDQHMWAWPLMDIQPFEPIIPCRGWQGFWNWSQEMAA